MDVAVKLGVLFLVTTLVSADQEKTGCNVAPCTEGNCGQLEICLLGAQKKGCNAWEIYVLAASAVRRCLYGDGRPCSLTGVVDCYVEFIYKYTSSAIPEEQRQNVVALSEFVGGHLLRLRPNCSVPAESVRELEQCIVPVTRRAEQGCMGTMRLIRLRFFQPFNAQTPWTDLNPSVGNILAAITSYTRACSVSDSVLVWPSYGPVSGGTLVTIVGALTSDTSTIINVSFGRTVACDIITSQTTPNYTVCITSSVLGLSGNQGLNQLINRPLEVFVGVIRPNQIRNTLSTKNNFTYKADPVVSSITGLQTVVSGGTVVNVFGDNLRSVRDPRMLVTLTYLLNSQPVQWTFPSICDVESNTQMYCVVPALVNPSEVLLAPISKTPAPTNLRRTNSRQQSRKKRDIHDDTTERRVKQVRQVVARRTVRETSRESADKTGEEAWMWRHARSTRRAGSRHKRSACGPAQVDGQQINDKENLTYCIDLQLDGVQNVLDECEQMDVFIDPFLMQFEESDNVRLYQPFWPFNDGFIEIKGSRLSSGLDCSQYNVEIGQGTCAMDDLTTNALFCSPPEEKPLLSDSEFLGAPQVMVRIGNGNIRFAIGFLDYQKNIFDHPPARYGIIAGIAGVLLIIAIIAIICCVVRTRR